MRLVHATLLLLACSLTALPAVAQAPYTDHSGTFYFTLPGLGTPVTDAPMSSVLLRLSDGSGFTAFVEPTGLWTRPPSFAFECYSDLGAGNLIVRGYQTQVTGDCVLGLEDVNGRTMWVVRWTGHDAPLNGVGYYTHRPSGLGPFPDAVAHPRGGLPV